VGVDVSVDVSVERMADGRLNVKLSTDPWEVNVRASSLQIASLRDIRNADWDEGRSMAVGESAGAPVFWCCKGNDATLMTDEFAT
jgi:hypothetical protein